MAYTANKTINDLENKATPVDADQLALGDTEDSNRAKKLTWTNAKAFLKTYFDTIYSTIASPTFTGTVTTPAIIVSSETASTIASFDASKNIKSLALATYPSLTELSYVKGVTSALQTQLNAKAATLAGTNNEIAYFNSSSTITSAAVATYPSLTELSYVKGVTSAIQTQITGLSNKLDINYTQITTPSDTNENTLYTKSIPANTLGTNNGVRLRIYFSDLTKTANGTYTLKFKYGATTLVTLTTASAVLSTAQGMIEFMLVATGATGTQKGFAQITGDVNGVNNATIGLSYCGVGTAAENSTGALNLVVTSTSQNTGTLSGYITADIFTLEKIA